MTRYLIAIHHPDDFDPSRVDEAMVRDIDALNEEMDAKGMRIFAGGLCPASRAKSRSICSLRGLTAGVGSSVKAVRRKLTTPLALAAIGSWSLAHGA